jgi:hypothetical protein
MLTPLALDLADLAVLATSFLSGSSAWPAA